MRRRVGKFPSFEDVPTDLLGLSEVLISDFPLLDTW